MADIKYNLDNIISKAIHRPIISKNEDLPPLYARIGTDTETSYDLEGMKNHLWQKATLVNYNSPTNVRRLFIGDKHATIQYYKPPIVKGKPSGKYWSTYSLNVPEGLNILAFKSLNYNRFVMDAAMRGAKTPDRIVLTQTGLGALSAHWKMSNIEEIFITPSILVSQDIMDRYPEAQELYSRFIDIQTGGYIPGKIIESRLPLQIFEDSNGANIKNIRTRFPRLRTVSLVSNIDVLIERPNATNLREGLTSTVAELGLKWFSHIKGLGASSISSFVLNDVPFDSSVQTEFSIRPGIYKFDKQILEPYAAEYKNKVLELGRKQRDAQSGTQKTEENTVKSEYEQYLDQLISDKGESITRAAIQLTFARSSKEEIDKAFSEMSTAGKTKYRQMLGR